MKVLILSYSLTGNNEGLSTSVAKALDAEHVKVAEQKPRTMGTIVLDMFLGRTPKVSMKEVDVTSYDLVLFVGPIWMGSIATPLRACFKRFGPDVARYGFVSISGGASGPNPKLGAELLRRMGKEPALLLDLHKADLLPPDPKPTRQDTSEYRLTDNDIADLTESVVARVAELAQDAG